MDDLDLRDEIYRCCAERGGPPTVHEVAELTGGVDEARTALRRLHDAHMAVLGADGEIRMALPFAARPTEHRVVTDDGRSWWANCAWDALAIPVAMGIDARIEATWLDTGEPVDLSIEGGRPSRPDGFVHVEIPARAWWDDIVET